MRILPLAWCVGAVPLLVLASVHETTYSSYHEWASGTGTDLEIWSPGALSRARVIDSVLVGEEQYVWDLCASRRGDLLIATGSEGRVFRFDGSSVHPFFDSPENDMLCITEDAKGFVWVGSSPDGIVYRIGPDGAPVEEFATHQGTVWCVVPYRNGVIAGTGPEGRVFLCTPGAAAREIVQTAMANVLSVLPLSDGRVLLSGDTPCVIQRIEPDSSVFTVARLDYDEARCLTALGPDSIGVVAISAPAHGGSGSALLTGRASGPFLQLWESPDSLVVDMMAGDEGVVVAGGWPGRAHWVKDRATFRRLTEVSAEQLLCCAGVGSRLYFGAGSPACLYWLTDRRASSASWRSPPIDAGTVARWGRVTWMGPGGGVSLRARSGNLGDPEEGWSNWSGGKREGNGWMLAAPEGRFAQLEVTLSEGDGSRAPVEWLQMRYQPCNRAPFLTSFTLMPPGQKPPGVIGRAALPTSRSGDRRDVRTNGDSDRYLSWMAVDEDGDALRYTVEQKPYPAGQWQTLAEEVEETYTAIAFGTLAEGWYLFRVSATDEPDNSPPLALSAVETIGPLLIDDTPPILHQASWKTKDGRPMLALEVHDAGSGVASAAISDDGRTWIILTPTDGIADSMREEFTAMPNMNESRVSVRLMDHAGNMTTATVHPPR